ncbi:MAG: hypothetical protein ACLR0U_14570 [Enterocloster clostridioformis]
MYLSLRTGTGAALHGDRVQIVVESQDRGDGRRAEGSVLKVLEHANKEVVGYYQKSKGFGFVIPDNQKISRIFSFPRAVIWELSPDIRWWRVKDFGDANHKPEEL